MVISYDMLISLLNQGEREQSEEFREAIVNTNHVQRDHNIYELINLLSQKETQYITYSHV